MDIIRSPVQRVHNPAIGFILIHSRTFFRNKTGFRQQCGELGNNLLLRFFIYVGHVVMRMFLFHALATECFSFFFQKTPASIAMRQTSAVSDAKSIFVLFSSLFYYFPGNPSTSLSISQCMVMLFQLVPNIGRYRMQLITGQTFDSPSCRTQGTMKFIIGVI